jgi:hypothetical protein
MLSALKSFLGFSPKDGKLGGGPFSSEVEISQATPGTTNYVENRANVRRGPYGTYRLGITGIDTLPAVTAPTVTDAGDGSGAFLADTEYYAAVCGGTVYGPGIVSSTGNVTTANDSTNTHTLRGAQAILPDSKIVPHAQIER